MLAIQIGDLVIGLASSETAVLSAWQEMLAGWPQSARHRTDLVIALELIDRLPAPPPTAPIYTSPPKAAFTALTVYQLEVDHLVLHLPGLAMVLLPIDGQQEPAVTGFLTPQALRPDILENILVQLLPPLFRRRGYYMLHGFAAARDGQAILLIGQSHSGKTTTGLALLRDGWSYLANDTVILQSRTDGIYALPFPGKPGIRPFTLELLPWLNETELQLVSEQQHLLPVNNWGAPAPVRAIYFPQINGQGPNKLEAVPASVAFTLLLEQSVQKWDSADVAQHLSFWEQLSMQASPYLLYLSQDLTHTATLLHESLKSALLAKVKQRA